LRRQGTRFRGRVSRRQFGGANRDQAGRLRSTCRFTVRRSSPATVKDSSNSPLTAVELRCLAARPELSVGLYVDPLATRTACRLPARGSAGEGKPATRCDKRSTRASGGGTLLSAPTLRDQTWAEVLRIAVELCARRRVPGHDQQQPCEKALHVKRLGRRWNRSRSTARTCRSRAIAKRKPADRAPDNMAVLRAVAACRPPNHSRPAGSRISHSRTKARPSARRS
jgi:hypothetical protein